jgi:hypothetical protein
VHRAAHAVWAGLSVLLRQQQLQAQLLWQVTVLQRQQLVRAEL